VIGVDPEVVLPRAGAVAGVVLGDASATGDVVEPVVERPDAARKKIGATTMPPTTSTTCVFHTGSQPHHARSRAHERRPEAEAEDGHPGATDEAGPKTSVHVEPCGGSKWAGYCCRPARDASPSRAAAPRSTCRTRLRHDTSLRAHGRVPEAAQLGAHDRESPVRVGVTRSSSRCRARRPSSGRSSGTQNEWMTSTACIVNLRLLADGMHELAGLDVALVRVLELPRELLPDDLHLQRVRASPVRSPRGRTRSRCRGRSR
jgi:hypothetical protein